MAWPLLRTRLLPPRHRPARTRRSMATTINSNSIIPIIRISSIPSPNRPRPTRLSPLRRRQNPLAEEEEEGHCQRQRPRTGNGNLPSITERSLRTSSRRWENLRPARQAMTSMVVPAATDRSTSTFPPSRSKGWPTRHPEKRRGQHRHPVLICPN